MDYVIVSRSGSNLLVRLEQGYNYQSIAAIAKISLPDISELTQAVRRRNLEEVLTLQKG